MSPPLLLFAVLAASCCWRCCAHADAVGWRARVAALTGTVLGVSLALLAPLLALQLPEAPIATEPWAKLVLADRIFKTQEEFG